MQSLILFLGPQESLWENLFEISPTQRQFIAGIYQNTMSLNSDRLQIKVQLGGETGCGADRGQVGSGSGQGELFVILCLTQSDLAKVGAQSTLQ